MKLTMVLGLLALYFCTVSAVVVFRRDGPKTLKWMNPADPRCGPVEPWSEHKPLEPIVGKTKEAKESQCQACKIRACNSGLPAPGKPGGCRCISYKDAAGNYATDCKNLLNKNLPVEYEECGEEARDCKALEGKCVSAKFKMDSAKEASWMKDDWKMPKSDSPKTPKWMNPADPRCGPVEPWSEHKPLEPIVGKTKEAKESQCQACKIRACNSGLPAPGKPGGCRCISYKDAAGNYATDCKNLLNKNLPVEYEECGKEARDCKALEGKCVSAKFKMDSAKEASWMKDDWEAPKIPKSLGVRAAGISALCFLGLALVGSM